MSTRRAIREHYERYPYPTVKELHFRDPADHLRGTLNYLLRRRAADALPRDARIWVAGCGTEQAVSWARRFPEGTVLGTDVSESALAVSRGLADQLGVRNLQLEPADLLQLEPAAPFDLVVSTGVLHHLPDPDLGLRKVREVLAPGGAALLMVYSRAHRGALQSFRAALDVLAPPDHPGPERFEMASKLLDALLTAERVVPPCPQVLEQLAAQRASDPAFVADALINPLERCYDIDELFAWLRRAELRHESWYRPAAWDIGAYLDDETLQGAIRRAPPPDQWRAVYHLAGLAGPMLEVLAVPEAQPERSPYDKAELLTFAPLWLTQIIGYRVEAGRITAEGRGPSYEERGDTIAGRSLPGGGPSYRWELPRAAEAILDACDGTRTVAELQTMFDELAPDDVVGLIRQFLPDQLGLIVPRF